MIRRFTQLHESAALIRAAQTWWGRLGVWLLAAVLLGVERQESLLVIPALALVLLFPERRRLILSLTAVAFGLNGMRWALGPELNLGIPDRWPLSPLDWLPAIGAAGAVVFLLYLAFLATKHFAQLPSPVRRLPQVTLHVVVWAVFVLAWTFPGHPFLIPIATALSLVVWRAGYMVLSGKRGNAAGTGFTDHLFYLWPVYGGTDPVPFGKGHDYLSGHEGRSAEDLAKSQLAGLKLLVLAELWTLALLAMGGLVYGDPGNAVLLRLDGWNLGIPHLRNLVAGTVQAPIPVAWLSLYADLVRLILALAIEGHVIIGCLRLFGFNVFRNTYKPLLSESLVEFWGRYHYYFKELLVEFFFYPCYLRHFKRWPRLRMFAAVFAATFVGNMYLHLLDNPELAGRGLYRMWPLLNPRLLYCLLLALGIWISMRRQQGLRGTTTRPPVLVRLRRIAGVWMFFSIIHLWNIHPLDLTFAQRTRLFFTLFGF